MNTIPSEFEDLMMAQQAIYNLDDNIFAYELFFRNNDEKMAHIIDGENATSQVLVNLCIGITEFESQMKVPFFINITEKLLTSESFFPIKPSLVYIEIVEDQKISAELVYAVEMWHKEGYRFALDNYEFDKKYDLLLPYIDIIKINVINTDPTENRYKINQLIIKEFTLLAEKVEDQNMYDTCKEIGFVLFQGYFLKHPNIIKGKRIPSEMSDALELAKELQDKDITTSKVTMLIRKNPALCYQLLRLLNSPMCGIQRQVTDLNEAVVYLGLNQIKKWAILITISSCSDKRNEVFRMALIRAKSCENLSIRQGSNLHESDFMAGIMSAIHLVLNIEQELIFKQISIDKKVVDAIYYNKGSIGERLHDVLSYEEFDFDYIVSLSHARRSDLSSSYAEASIWANEIMTFI